MAATSSLRDGLNIVPWSFSVTDKNVLRRRLQLQVQQRQPLEEHSSTGISTRTSTASVGFRVKILVSHAVVVVQCWELSTLNVMTAAGFLPPSSSPPSAAVSASASAGISGGMSDDSSCADSTGPTTPDSSPRFYPSHVLIREQDPDLIGLPLSPVLQLDLDASKWPRELTPASTPAAPAIKNICVIGAGYVGMYAASVSVRPLSRITQMKEIHHRSDSGTRGTHGGHHCLAQSLHPRRGGGQGPASHPAMELPTPAHP